MRAWSRTSLLVCAALGALGACSTDEGAAGGDAGHAGSAGTAGMAGSAGTGGVASAGSGGGGNSGSPTGGGGDGSAGQAVMVGPECTACIDTSCAAARDPCETSMVCSAWLTCIGACSTPACLRECDDTHDDAALLIAAVYACACSSCASECKAAGVCEQTCNDDAGLQASGEAPATLADTGLYVQDMEGAWELSPHVREFAPEYKLWSDAAEKKRWIYLPECQSIDTSDMDHWDFPVGTRLWKEFVVGELRLETRLIHRYGPSVDQWLMVSYQWPADNVGTAGPVLDPELATLVSAVGVQDANGTLHDIPSQAECVNCHGKLSERVLGFSAIQLSHELGGLTLAELVDWGVLSDPPSAGYDPPGDPTTQAALGYLHANCGNCHNETGVTSTDGTQLQSLWMRLLVSHESVEQTHAYATGVNQQTANDTWNGLERIDPTTPGNSVVLTRLYSETAGTRMPPLREKRDDAGHAAVQAWIDGLE
jgi:hypothetical protein